MLQRMHLAHSPDRRWFALAIGASTLRLWRLERPAHELSGGEPIDQPYALEMNTGGHGIAGMIFADAGHLIVAHNDGVLQCWSLHTGDEVPEPFVRDEDRASADALPGQRELGDYHSVPLGVEERQGREVVASLAWLIRLDASVEAFTPRRLTQPRPRVRAVIGAQDGSVLLLDAAIGRKPVVRWLGTHRASVVRAALSRDGSHVATASRDRRLAIWRPDEALVSDAEGGAWRVFDESGGEVWALSFSGAGRYLVSGGIDNNIYAWDTRAERALRAVGRAHDGWIAALDWSEDDKLIAAASWDKTVGLFRAGTLQPLYCFEYHQDYVSHVMFVPGTTLLVSTGYDRSVALWDWRQAKMMASFQEHEDWIQALEWVGDGVFLTASNDLTVRLWSAKTMAPLGVLSEEKIEFGVTPGMFETSSLLGGLGSFSSVAMGRFDASRRVLGRGDSVPTEEIFDEIEALTNEETSLGEEVSVFVEERELALPAFLKRRSLAQDPSEFMDDAAASLPPLSPAPADSLEPPSVEEIDSLEDASIGTLLEDLQELAVGEGLHGVGPDRSTSLEIPATRVPPEAEILEDEILEGDVLEEESLGEEVLQGEILEEEILEEDLLEDLEDLGTPQSLAFMDSNSAISDDPENTGESSWAELARSVTLTGQGPVFTPDDLESISLELESDSAPEVVREVVHEGVSEGVHVGVSEGVHEASSEVKVLSEPSEAEVPEPAEDVVSAEAPEASESVSLSALRDRLSALKQRSRPIGVKAPEDQEPEEAAPSDASETPDVSEAPLEPVAPPEEAPPAPREASEVSEPVAPPVAEVSSPQEVDTAEVSAPVLEEAVAASIVEETPEPSAPKLAEPSEPPMADQAPTLVQRAKKITDSTAEYQVPPDLAGEVANLLEEPGDLVEESSSPSTLLGAPVAMMEPPPSEQVTRRVSEPIEEPVIEEDLEAASEPSPSPPVASEPSVASPEETPEEAPEEVSEEAPAAPPKRRLTLRDLAKSKRLRKKLDALPAQPGVAPETSNDAPAKALPEVQSNIFASESSISGFSDAEEEPEPEVFGRDGFLISLSSSQDDEAPQKVPEEVPEEDTSEPPAQGAPAIASEDEASEDEAPEDAPAFDPDATMPPRAMMPDPPRPSAFQAREQTPLSGPPVSMSYSGDETIPPISAAFQEADEPGDVTQLPFANHKNTSEESFTGRRRTANWNNFDDSDVAESEVRASEGASAPEAPEAPESQEEVFASEEDSEAASVTSNMLASPLIELDERFFETSFVESDPYPGEAPEAPVTPPVAPSEPSKKRRFMRVDRLLSEKNAASKSQEIDRSEFKDRIRKKISAMREDEENQPAPEAHIRRTQNAPRDPRATQNDEPGGLLRQTQEQVIPTIHNGLRESTAEHSNPQELFADARAARQASNPFVEDAANRNVSAAVTRSEVDRALAARDRGPLSPHPFTPPAPQEVTSSRYDSSQQDASQGPRFAGFSRMEATAPVSPSVLDEALEDPPEADLSSTFFGMSGLVVGDDTPAEFLQRGASPSNDQPDLYDLTIPEMWHMRVGERKAAMKIFRRRATRAGLFRNQAQFTTDAPKITGLHFQPDLKFFATCGLGPNVEVWLPEQDRRIYTLSTNASKIGDVTATPDGRILIAGDDAALLHLWLLPRDLEANSGSVGQATLEGHTASIMALDVDSTGKLLLSGSVDGVVKLWELETGDCIATLQAHQGPVTSVAFSAKGPLTVGMDGSLKMWDKRGQLINAIDTFDSLTCVSYRKGATYLADIEGRVYRYHRGKTDLLFEHESSVRDLQVTGDDVGASVSVDGKVFVFNWGDTEPFQTLDLGTPSYAVSLTGEVLCVGTEGGHIEYYIRRES